jgi:hypothetical protein
MKFWICPPNNVVTVDDAPMTVDCSAMAKNIWLVDWGGKDGTILYSDRVGVRVPFTDPSAYLPYINLWMLAAQAPNTNELGTPSPQPITVAQAQSVKQSLVGALFDLKRQLPYGNYSGKDSDVTQYQTQAMLEVAGAGSSSIGGVNNSIAGVADSVNASIADFNAKIGSFNASISAFNSDTATFNSNQSYNVNYMNAGYVDSINVSLSSGSAPSGGGQVSFSYMPHQGMPVNAMGTMGQLSYMDQIPSPTAGAGAGSPTLTALQGILNRYNSLNSVGTTHNVNISNLTTVPAVAAYDITSGW